MTEREYRLRGGRQPDVSALANLLAHHGIAGPDAAPLTEPLLFLAGGGIGAGYHLGEFTADGSKTLTLGFRDRPGDHRGWLSSTVERLGLPVPHTTGWARVAGKRLGTELAAGRPALVLPERSAAGYWQLPEDTGGAGAHFVVAYAETGDGVLVDDRNTAPLTVDRATLTRARSRAGARHVLLAFRPDDREHGTPVDPAAAVRAGLAHCARTCRAEAWATWARQVTDERARKNWPTVFAERRGLVGALLSAWTAISPSGPGGGHLRDLFADGLAEAAPLLGEPALTEHARTWRAIAGRWQELARVLLGDDHPEFGWMRGLVSRVGDGVRAGDAGREAAAGAATELRRLRTHYDAETPFTERQARALFAELGARLQDIHVDESRAIAALRDITTR
ncbi:butirosin biosynthesis protein H-like [Prauserella shujinwangii]|uniref:Butirosin biosynthesis protein H-like n=1 Tax=Prauserella shujinwangii TaxID=1453103 RepID=A0A2T0LQT5_9PSEU|nr:BtrH N-terminal domain-containing protein [Prauserella shujinwangii]PRX45642.1 butirosin biosynthesis protein H-like [Prauserella shujinwangii]